MTRLLLANLILWLILIGLNLGSLVMHRQMADLHSGQYCLVKSDGYPDYDHCITENAK